MMIRRRQLSILVFAVVLAAGMFFIRPSVAVAKDSGPVPTAPHFSYVVKACDWAEYLVEEAASATVLCSSDINANGYLPLAVGDRVRLIVTDITEDGHSYVYPNDTVALRTDGLEMDVSLNGRSVINSTYMSLIPFGIGGSAYNDAYSTGIKPAFHPVKEDGYWTIFGQHQTYVHEEMLHGNFTMEIRETQVDMVYEDSYHITASRNVGAPLRMSNSDTRGGWRVSIVDTNIMGLIGSVRPRCVTITSPTSSSGVSSSSIVVWWTQSLDVNFTRYELIASGARCTSGTGVSIANITDRSVTSFNASGLTPSIFYYFTVRVYNRDNCYADSDAVGVRTLSLSASSPVRIATIDLTDPQAINSSRPLIIDARSEGGFTLKLTELSAPCTLTISNITSPPACMRPEPWAIDSEGRLKILGNILQINTTGDAGFTGQLEMHLSLQKLLDMGINVNLTPPTQIHSLSICSWDNATQKWTHGYSTGRSIVGDKVGVSLGVWTGELEGCYAVAYRLLPTPVTFIMPNSTDVTDTSVRLSWTKNGDPDFAYYEVYKSSTQDELGEKLTQIQNNATTKYNVNGLTKGETYYFTVRVLTMAGIFYDGIYSDSNIMKMTAGSPGSISMIIPEFGAIPALLVLALTTLLVMALTILPQHRGVPEEPQVYQRP